MLLGDLRFGIIYSFLLFDEEMFCFLQFSEFINEDIGVVINYMQSRECCYILDFFGEVDMFV